jgi:hypothetical protein
MTDVTHDTVAAKQAITEMLYRYCRGLDRMDRDLALTVWHPGGGAHYGGIFDGTGEGFIEWVWQAHAGFERHSHQITNVLIEVDGDTAVSEAYVTVVLRMRGDGDQFTDVESRGRYLDRWSRQDGRWAIDDRSYVNDFTTSRDVPESFALEETDARRDRDDPSYSVLS